MVINQISVFVQNEKGRLSEIAGVLRDNDVNIKALSIADTTDFGIMRIIVDKPGDAVNSLKEAGFPVSITKVIAVGIDNQPGGLCSTLTILNGSDINVEYMYTFMGPGKDKAYVIIRVEDTEKAIKTLDDNNIEMVKSEDIEKL